ncbi:hypothetical protein BCY84_18686 [Trypanosoma cruzi cruzi]|uniref:DUF726 domain-containing protein n=1 Tax=Trypanosoma cruzi TaxID=5693 RepID=A0A2V2VYS6_TRYCR|nr:hypothetical protein BCY84_18686 [Trypanosoma cruzi cruzi]PWV01518.1 hypothetical protein C4B63_4g372 [Trypanosoma cruzi]
MLFKEFTFPWEPYRAARDEDELQAVLSSTTKKFSEEERLSPECRFAARRLMYACVGDQKLLNLLDGALAPPPYRLEDLQDRQITRKEIEAAMDVIPLELDPVIVLFPFNLAMSMGAYDAHLRAAVRRLCWLFAIPFNIIEARERALMDALLLSHDGGDESLKKKQNVVRSHKKRKKRSISRAATVGAFAAVGGAALAITGGLAAPLIGPAMGSLASATAATFFTLESVGEVILGGTAVAAFLSGMVGVATEAATLITLITPVLTVTNLTAIFGIGGASLAGYKAYRRTAESDVFMIRSITEIEMLPALAQGDDVLLSVLTKGQIAQCRDAAQRLAVKEGEQEVDMNLQEIMEEAGKGGIVVPAHTRAVTMCNVAAKDHFKQRMRCLTFALQCSLNGYRLELKALKLTVGKWGIVPPKLIPEENCGIFLCLNRFARPTGAGCVVCYNVRPITSLSSPTLRLWVLAELSLMGNVSVAVSVTKCHEAFQPKKMLKKLRKMKIESDETFTSHNVVVGCFFSPLPFVMLSNLTDGGNTLSQHHSDAVIPVKELTQRIVETMKLVRERRRIGVSIVNNSKHLIHVLKCEVMSGVQSHRTSNLPTTISSREALFAVFTNSELSLKGAEAFIIIEVVNSGANADARIICESCYMKLQFEVNALNSISAFCVAAPSLGEIAEHHVHLRSPSEKKFKPILMPESFVWADMTADTKKFLLNLCIEDFVERVGKMEVQKCPSLTIAVGGFVSIFDERRPQQDQQLALWANHLSGSSLFGMTEGYVVHWEDKNQTKFGRTIDAGLAKTLTKELGGKAFEKATNVARSQLLRGGIFAGIQALDAVKGSLSLPMYAIWFTGAIDNSFAKLLNRAEYTGKDLAHALLDPQKGRRPVSLIGFSFGSRVIVECLNELHRVEAFGVIENVYLMGSIVSSSRTVWGKLRSVVAGRLVNIYSRGDWFLWLMYKANKATLRPMAGISHINVPGVENLDVSYLVDNHFDYAEKLKEIIDAIPGRPRRQMYEKSSGSPGAVVGPDDISLVSKGMMSSMESFLGDSQCATLAITNRLASDIKGFNTELHSLVHVVNGGYFDFEPPDVIPFSRSAVCGLVVDGESTGGGSVTGMVSYVVSLDSASADLLLSVFFLLRSSRKGGLVVAADVRILRRTQETLETESERQRRLEEFCRNESEDPKRIQIKCESSERARHEGPLTPSFTVDLDDVFDDGSREAVFHVTTKYEDHDDKRSGCRIDIVALLTQSSNLTQRKRFTAELFDSIYQTAVEPKSAIPVPLKEMRLAMKDFNDSFAPKLKGSRGGAAIPQPIVLANCGDLPLIYAGLGGAGALPAENMGIEWIRYPPREIPPNNCVLTVVRRCLSSSSSSLNSVNGAVLDVFSLISDTGRCDVQLLGSSASGDGNDAAGGGIGVACQCEVDPSADGTGSASVMTTELEDVSFTLVSISWSSEKNAGESKQSQSSDADALMGWILID